MTDPTVPAVGAPYEPLPGAHDDLVAPDGTLRGPWAAVAPTLLGSGDLDRRSVEAARLLADDGVTYQGAPTGGPGHRPWAADPVPLVLAADEWATLERGVAQRAQLLDRVLDDLYGPRRLVRDGLLPPEVVYGHPGFLRPADGIRVPGAHQLFLAATDLARDDQGRHVVLSDRAQAPSGAGYALENRVVMSRVLPDLHRSAQVQRLAPFLRALRSALLSVAPDTDDVPRIVVLTPGPWSETSFEHGYLATQLGVPLVQGEDLRVRDGRVWMRSIDRLEPVHVILRRVDAQYCDPVELLPGSSLGVPGLLEACRIGNVSVVNTFGSGVLENPGLMPFLPRVAEVVLDEELLLPSAETWWCGEPAARHHVLTHLEGLVVKPIARGAGTTTQLGWALDAAGRDELRRRIESRPHEWVGQRPVAIGTAPSLVEGALAPRRTVLRTFAVTEGEGYSVMPGGLTRVATRPDQLVITNQAGAVSKDTCVLAAEPEHLTGFWLQPPPDAGALVPAGPSTSPRAGEHLFWMSRYAERAASLTRLLRVVTDRRNEFAAGATPAGVASIQVLLRALTAVSGTWPGFSGDAGAGLVARPDDELRSLVVDELRPGTLAYDLRRLLDAATEVRDQVSGDTWLVMGHLDRELDDLRRRAPLTPDPILLGRVLQALIALAGLAAESTVRDGAWRLQEAGRRLERALQASALLRATVVDSVDTATDSLVLESALIVAESIITYRRRSRSRARVVTALDLLVVDPDNPRSLAFQTRALRAAVAGLPGPATGASTALRRCGDAAELVAAADTSDLGHLDDGGRRGRLAAFLDDLDDHLHRAADAIDAEHFTHQVPQRSVFTPNDPGRR
ncbi:MAG: circularly permuted type 2 ATP-grasp protein [Acidimicrobiales bacterium]|nr:circularly permuted type 2 ATP-grasp protein [Acidimicrobiales bacterium]MCB9371163.1 circularly permuted type 2 ATP-grasp protein [Microthrixaceae bacterium]